MISKLEDWEAKTEGKQNRRCSAHQRALEMHKSQLQRLQGWCVEEGGAHPSYRLGPPRQDRVVSGKAGKQSGTPSFFKPEQPSDGMRPDKVMTSLYSSRGWGTTSFKKIKQKTPVLQWVGGQVIRLLCLPDFLLLIVPLT